MWVENLWLATVTYFTHFENPLGILSAAVSKELVMQLVSMTHSVFVGNMYFQEVIWSFIMTEKV